MIDERWPTVLGVPIDCVGVPEAGDPPFGTELSPAALRGAGLVRAVGAADAGDLAVRLVGRDRDPSTGVLAWASVREVTSAVRTAVRDLVGSDRIPLVIGGCCTLLPGALAGARDALGPTALAYLDGHLDLYDGRTSPTGEPADMPIAVVTGLGPAAWAADVGAPLLAPGQLALLGPRDRAEALTYATALPEHLGHQPERTPDALRADGMAAAGLHTCAELSAATGRYWVHLDVDVLDQAAFPATDYLMPGGLSLPELGALLRPLLGTTALAGLSLGCYNPDKDPDGACGRELVDLLAQALARD
ncbi:arginase family protein [Catellatospora sp. KI3]|uniref:arginase family protein n=1 Tax=Catellatospora sp. KI3 TaxID=3041620 RepID=UPI002482B36F|nr:arginase family protein [Catellatospora sp. KI3]MDI1461224.1 arginase family protein [Catellatospora sp. KI3]